MTQQLNIKKITQFLNEEYKNYSIYSVESRAIPCLCDGLKPGARKILHAAFVGTLKDGKTYKLLSLVGDTMNKSLFAHGDSSLVGTICTISKSFINFFNPIEIEGQGGSLRDPDAGAPRYLYIRKSKWADLLYNRDYELLNFINEEGQFVEPMQYYPIIPNVLCSIAMGMGNGYSFHTMSWHPLDVLDSCIEVLKSRTDKKNKISINIRPYLRDIKQDNWKFEDGKWYCYGEWKFNQSKDIMTVTDLPADVTYVEFEKLLNKLCEKGYIKDYQNKSEDGKVLYDIIFPKKQLAVELKKDKSGKRIANTFKLIKQIPDDLLWLLDENRKLKHFDTKQDVIEYFVNWRLTLYSERKKRTVKLYEQRYKENSDLVRFIELVCKGKLKIRNRSKSDIKVDLDREKLPITLISTSMSKCTIEERDELLKENEEIRKQLEYIKNTTERQMYINDLNELRKEISKEVKK
ncbi:MAG: hypothetical protein J6D03_09580 [Clostridia bacterium]|nr:hypothetical protein [Clostridia bacterium]